MPKLILFWPIWIVFALVASDFLVSDPSVGAVAYLALWALIGSFWAHITWREFGKWMKEKKG